MQVVLEKLGVLKNKLKDNLHSQDNPQGLLTKDADHYMACLTIQHEKLEGFYREDETKLTKSLKTIKAQVGVLQTKIE